uniref:ARAD1A14124p n=1 Tax=Blastobotrys adeninivorans TaxID=409370 RepID=A0A060SXM9_BLAAD
MYTPGPDSASCAGQNTCSNKVGKVVRSACIQCRSRKIKCNGKQPCHNCLERQEQCEYVKSRRGLIKSRRKKLSDDFYHVFMGEAELPVEPCPLGQGSSNSAAAMDSNEMSDEIDETTLANQLESISSVKATKTIGDLTANLHTFTSAYLRYFHSAHPFVKVNGNGIATRHEPLLLAIAAIASRWTSFKSVGSAFADLSVERLGSCVEDVQAMIILAIDYHSRGKTSVALKLLQRASSIEIEANKETELTIRELWMILVIFQALGAPVNAVEKSTDTYPNFMAHYKRLIFSPDMFTPTAFRVFAFQVLDAVNRKEPMEEMDNVISTLLFTLPSPADNEEIFTAHCIANFSRLMLHRRLAQESLAFYIALANCMDSNEFLNLMDPAEKPDPNSADLTQQNAVRQCDMSSAAIIKLAQRSSPGELDHHSPVAVCPLAFASLVQLALLYGPNQDSEERSVSAVGVGLSALRRMATKWDNAGMLVYEIQNLSTLLLSD